VSLRTAQQRTAAAHTPESTSQAPLRSHSTIQIQQRGDQKSSTPPAAFLQTIHSCHQRCWNFHGDTAHEEGCGHFPETSSMLLPMAALLNFHSHGS